MTSRMCSYSWASRIIWPERTNSILKCSFTPNKISTMNIYTNKCEITLIRLMWDYDRLLLTICGEIMKVKSWGALSDNASTSSSLDYIHMFRVYWCNTCIRVHWLKMNLFHTGNTLMGFHIHLTVLFLINLWGILAREDILCMVVSYAAGQTSQSLAAFIQSDISEVYCEYPVQSWDWTQMTSQQSYYVPSVGCVLSAILMVKMHWTNGFM